MRNRLEYPITLRPLDEHDGGGWLAELPDLPGCMADGATPEEAMTEAIDAARSWLKTAQTHGDPIPVPSRASRDVYSGRWLLRTPKSLHKRLSERARAEGVSLNTLAVTLLAQALGERSHHSR
ncbi:MAG TPA: toxin-antitoxin system HicB family antitoxin [Rhizomicrobium sp.]|jgi:antitoxin HicB|nr:toxin-antitoxin system HicB family antitoxin [Rhizomicrobium sp.]